MLNRYPPPQHAAASVSQTHYSSLRFRGIYATEAMMKKVEGNPYYTRIKNDRGIAYITGPELTVRTQLWKARNEYRKEKLEQAQAQTALFQYEAYLIEKALALVDKIVRTLD